MSLSPLGGLIVQRGAIKERFGSKFGLDGVNGEPGLIRLFLGFTNELGFDKLGLVVGKVAKATRSPPMERIKSNIWITSP